MEYNHTHYIAPKDCPFTYKGRNLAECRRAVLQKIAKTVDSKTEGPKNEILGELIVRLKTLGRAAEITEENV